MGFISELEERLEARGVGGEVRGVGVCGRESDSVWEDFGVFIRAERGAEVVEDVSISAKVTDE